MSPFKRQDFGRTPLRQQEMTFESPNYGKLSFGDIFAGKQTITWSVVQVYRIGRIWPPINYHRQKLTCASCLIDVCRWNLAKTRPHRDTATTVYDLPVWGLAKSQKLMKLLLRDLWMFSWRLKSQLWVAPPRGIWCTNK